MKVLVVSQRKLLPMTDGALIGSMGLLNYLHDLGLSIEVISFIEDEDYTQEELNQLQQIVDKVHSVKLHWRSTALNLSLKYPNNIRKYKRKAMERKILEVKDRFKPDFAVIDHLQMYEYAKCFGDMRYVLHTHNVESDIWADFAKKQSWLVKPLVSRSAKMLREYEIKALEESAGVTACSETDMEKFRKMCPNVNGAVFHSYLKFPRIKDNADIRNVRNTIVYVGSYSWFPNQVAAKFLVECVMPALRERIQGIKLYLVGKSPTEEISQYAIDNDDVFVTGTVESVDPYLKDADVFVNAIEDGGGINIKVIEAMGKGIPVVTSVFGARGFEAKNNENMLVYKDSKECVDQI